MRSLPPSVEGGPTLWRAAAKLFMVDLVGAPGMLLSNAEASLSCPLLTVSTSDTAKPSIMQGQGTTIKVVLPCHPAWTSKARSTGAWLGVKSVFLGVTCTQLR